MTVKYWTHCDACDRRVECDDPEEIPDGWTVITTNPGFLEKHFCSWPCLAGYVMAKLDPNGVGTIPKIEP